ncbi:MAG: hypothetical protein IPP51_07935 [Bacteroidetes bacterium]|nr:hypothetical protein [Bacteroidota bacterium]
MKHYLSLPTLIVLASTVMFQGCESNNRAVKIELTALGSLPGQLVSSENDIAFAQKETYSDYEKFIKEAKLKISRNEASIVRMNARIPRMKKASQEAFKRSIDLIASKNVVLKAKLELYIEDGVGNWQTFRKELFAELNALDLEINNAMAQK